MLNHFKTASPSQKTCLTLFLILSFSYVGLEIYFNYLLFDQMSTMTSAVEIQMVERYGKLFTGIGICLLLMKMLLPVFQTVFQFILAFIVIGGISIALSFYVQNKLITMIVWDSDDEQRGKALLITQASTTIVPYYDDGNATFAFERRWEEFKLKAKARMSGHHLVMNETMTQSYISQFETAKREHYFAVAEKCEQNPNIFNVSTALDKAFFPYVELNKPFSEEKYKQVALVFHRCLIEDPQLYAEYVVDPMNQQLDAIYNTYKMRSDRYHWHMNKVREEEKKGTHRYIIRMKRDKIQQAWKEGVADFGNISPNLSKAQFFENAAVKAHIFKVTKQNVIYKPNQTNMKAEYLKKLPETLFSNFDVYRPYIAELNVQQDKKHISGGANITATRAYKAVVMPMVALSFSMVFMLLNIVSLVSLCLFSHQPKLGRFFVVCTMVGLLTLPIFKANSHLGDEAKGSFTSYVLQAVYFYQSAIIKIYTKE